MVEISSQFETTLKRLGGDKQLFQELATYFIEDAGELLQAMRRGLAAGNIEPIERAAHSLRGLAANFEAEQVVSVAASLEQMASRGELQSVPPVLLDLETEVQALRGMLKGYTLQSATTRDCTAIVPEVH